MIIPQEVIAYYEEIRKKYGKFILSSFMKEIPENVLVFLKNLQIDARTLNIVLRKGYKEYPIYCTCGNIISNVKRSYCSDECSKREGQKHAEETFQQKYGCKRPAQNKKVLEKTRKTNLKRYGSECPFQTEEVKKKIEETSIKRYGIKNPSQTERCKEKRLETNKNRYGGNAPLASKEIRDKVKETNLRKYGVENVFQDSEIKKRLQKTNLISYGTPFYKMSEQFKKQNNREAYYRLYENLEQKNHVRLLSSLDEFLKGNRNYECLVCRKSFKADGNSYVYLHCPYCSKKGYSLKEKEIVQYIKSFYNGIVIENDRSVLERKELDIYLPHKNLAFEFDGVYWHSNKFCSDDEHLKKFLSCKEKGIRLVHLFETYWDISKEICKSLISSKLDTYEEIIESSECYGREISICEYKNFIRENSFSLNCEANICYGLFYKKNLVAVIGFIKNKEYRIEKYCTKKFIKITNGLGKILKISNIQQCSVILDRNLDDIEEYHEHGFSVVDYFSPRKYFYELKNYKKLQYTCDFLENYLWICDCGTIQLKLS